MNDMQRLLNALSEVRDEVDFAHEDHLVEDGLIDSLDLTRIIAALDETFDIHIRAGEIEPENFNAGIKSDERAQCAGLAGGGSPACPWEHCL